MIKRYEKFVEELIQSLIIATNYDSNRIYFKKKGEISAATDDRLCIDYKVFGGVRETCALFIKDMYEEYEKGVSIEVMTKEIVEQLRELKKSKGFSRTLKLPYYDKVQQYLFIRLLNVTRNTQNLQNAIIKTLGDIAFVVYLEVKNVEGMLTSIKVSKEYLKAWNKEKEEVIENALQNTLLRTPPRIYHWDEPYFNESFQGHDFMNSVFEFDTDNEEVHLSTYPRLNGAVAVFLPNVAARLGELLGENFYIEFCNIHECVIYKESIANLEEIRCRLKWAASDKEDAEFLSKYIFHYDIQAGHFNYVK